MSKASPGATKRLSAFAAALQFDDVPSEVIAITKNILADTMGTALAATTLGSGCSELTSVARALAGRPESTILGSSDKLSSVNAALANGGLAHALNYDPIGPEVGHVGIATLTAPLAIAESIGRVSGREFLAAAVSAAEVSARTNAAQARTGKPASEKFLAGQIFGYFGAAAGAGRLLGLCATQMHSAFGLALMQVSGTMQVVVGGDPPAKAIYGAFPNHGGVLAALLARAGLGAECDALEGSAGVYEMIYAGDYEGDTLTEGLGLTYLLTGAQFKPWPTSGIVHPFIEAAGELVRRGVDATQIASIKLVARSTVKSWCEPIEERRRPANAASAANSILFSVAKTFANGALTLNDFTEKGLADDRALTLANIATPSYDDQIIGGIVRVVTKDGRQHEAAVETPLGHPSKPLGKQQLFEKFANCCSNAQFPLSTAQATALFDAIQDLENLEDVAALTALARGEAANRQISRGRKQFGLSDKEARS